MTAAAHNFGKRPHDMVKGLEGSNVNKKKYTHTRNVGGNSISSVRHDYYSNREEALNSATGEIINPHNFFLSNDCHYART